ncbi:MAG: YybS family protein [Synergistaceae bacterium]|nr:YybS family protein [Synergistaceae bacterium]
MFVLERYIIGISISLLSTIPISLIGIRQGPRKAYLSVISIAILMSLPFGYEGLMSYVFIAGISGIAFGILARKTNSAGESILGLTIAIIASTLIFEGLMFYTRGYSFSFNENHLNEIIESLEDSGVSEDILIFMKHYLNLIIPSVLVIISGFSAFMNYLFVSKIEQRRKRTISDSNTGTNELEIFPLPPFEQWSFPRSLLSAFVLAFIITLFDSHRTSVMLISTELNLMILTFILFSIQGLSFIWWFMIYKNLNFGVRFSIIIVILLFISVFFLGLIVMGLLDIAFNLKQRMRRKNK